MEILKGNMYITRRDYSKLQQPQPRRPVSDSSTDWAESTKSIKDYYPTSHKLLCGIRFKIKLTQQQVILTYPVGLFPASLSS